MRHRSRVVPQRIAVIGDSIAYGRGDPSGDGWAGQLRRAFIEADSEVHRFFNLSIPGIGTAEVEAILRDEIPRRTPDLLVLAFGVNDARRPSAIDAPNATPILVFEQCIQAMLERTRTTIDRVVLISPLPVDETRTRPIFGDYFLNADIAAYRQVLDQSARNAGVTVIPVHEDIEDRYDLLADGIHPTAEGHSVISRRIWSTLFPPVVR